jgi:hypothetical protein
MELQTTLNGTPVTVAYHVEIDEVDCFDRGTGSEYTKTIADCVIDSVEFCGVNIMPVISDMDMDDLEMECQAHYEEEVTA